MFHRRREERKLKGTAKTLRLLSLAKRELDFKTDVGLVAGWYSVTYDHEHFAHCTKYDNHKGLRPRMMKKTKTLFFNSLARKDIKENCKGKLVMDETYIGRKLKEFYSKDGDAGSDLIYGISQK